MLKHYEDGTVVRIDQTSNKLNTLNVIGTSLPFNAMKIFLKFDRPSYFEKDKYYQLHDDFSRTEVTYLDLITAASMEYILLINESQIKPLVSLALEHNECTARLDRPTCELIFKMGFMTANELELIQYIS
ncbi:hypothetical protein [Viridibacillus arvi]|uniref:hypothetical protein n=1 Tax=Viridibacillus arvi TaxID=263475 RepID=UPI0034CD05F6